MVVLPNGQPIHHKPSCYNPPTRLKVLMKEMPEIQVVIWSEKILENFGLFRYLVTR